MDIKRPHVFILGAGASVAAFPNGDRNGKRLPTMENFVEVLGMKNLLEKNKIDYQGKNFEDIFSNLDSQNADPNLKKEIENKIRCYFTSLEIPETPTIYDHLIVSLREKDVIATFNWDPFLWQAAYRIHHRITEKIPKLFFLHGNVAIKIDKEKKKVVDRNTNSIFPDSPLLYPIKNKDYQQNPFIESQWRQLQHYLKEAYMLTIFGYSAPKTDTAAIDLLKQGWGDKNKRVFEQTEIIDIKPEKILHSTWNDFKYASHYDIYDKFNNSRVASFPRRSCESLWKETMDVQFLDYNNGPTFNTFPQMKEWIQPLLDEENH